MASETVQKAIKSIRGHRERFEGFCRSLSAEELARPVPESTWTVNDFIIHLATLDPVIGRWFDGVREGRGNELRNPDGTPFDVDAWNEIEVSQRRSWPLERVLAEGAQNRARLIESLGRLEDKDIDQVVRFTGDNKRDPADVPLKLFLLGWGRHDPIHVADMLKALPERRDDPEMVAWLDDPAVKWYQDAMSGPAKR
jgi:hypothetical protein